MDVLKAIGNYLVYVSPAVVGVTLGGLLFQWFWIRKANESALIEYLTKELTDLVDETIEYWSLDCTGTKDEHVENRERAKLLEQRIKGDIKNLYATLGHYSERYCRNTDFSLLMGEVNDACTNGAFETAKRAPDLDRYLNVINTTHRVRRELFRRRV